MRNLPVSGGISTEIARMYEAASAVPGVTSDPGRRAEREVDLTQARLLRGCPRSVHHGPLPSPQRSHTAILTDPSS
jgi:hypothetical protein